jgi:transposase
MTSIGSEKMLQNTLIQPALQHPNQSIGVDISKDKFDACTFPGGERGCFPNDNTGFKTFLKWQAKFDVERVVFEPTGAYHRAFERHVAKAGVPVCKVNPYLARCFAKGAGKRMKTDEVDAHMLGRMGHEQDLLPGTITSDDVDTMQELCVARRALMKDKTATANRYATVRHPIVKAQLKARIAQIKRDLAQIDATLETIVAANPNLKQRKKILLSISGIGVLTAHFLIASMPELGCISNAQAASLVGLAPIPNSSGKHIGKAHIGGGRANVRQALFMPALVAIQHNPDLKNKYHALVDAHKPKMIATVAIMRKLIILANTLLQKGRLWTKNRP